MGGGAEKTAAARMEEKEKARSTEKGWSKRLQEEHGARCIG